MKAVTLKDVAQLSGVSQAVVSTVLNNRANNGVFVSEVTKQRVIEAAKALSYVTKSRPLPPIRRIANSIRPNSSENSHLIALLLGRRFGGTLFTDIFYGVNEVLTPHNLHPIVLDTYAETYQKAAEKEAGALKYVLDGNLAGVILWHEGGPANVDLVRQVREAQIPIVAIDRRVPTLELDFAGTDNQTAAYAATKHLISRGHTKIAHLTSLGMTDAASERLTGYQHALIDAGLDPSPKNILLALDGGRNLNREIFRHVFSAPDAPTAIFLVSDYWAPTVIAELSSIGLRVPEDVALVGFDDVAQPGFDENQLTSMAQDFDGIGRTAAEMIVEQLHHPGAAPRTHKFPATLIVRRSSAGREVPASGKDELLDEVRFDAVDPSVKKKSSRQQSTVVV
jgi:DNA-binding LacI/PurR family transcriptional regulator